MDDDTTRGADVARDASGQPVDRPQTVGTKAAVTAPVGAAAGAAAGATAGTLTGGPVGTIIGAIIGAVGGGLAGFGASDEAQPTTEDEEFYRTNYQGATSGLADAAYERARPAYHLGHVAALNPDWRGRPFEDIEPELQRGWSDDARARYGSWESARGFARVAYERTLSRTNAGSGTVPVTDAPVGTTPLHAHASFSDPLPAGDDVAGTQSDPRPLPPEPVAGSADPLERGSLSDQGGFGVHLAPGTVRDADASRQDDERR